MRNNPSQNLPLTFGNSSLPDPLIIRKQSVLQEIGGPKGLEPTRYGDWENKGRCYDF